MDKWACCKRNRLSFRNHPFWIGDFPSSIHAWKLSSDFFFLRFPVYCLPSQECQGEKSRQQNPSSPWQVQVEDPEVLPAKRQEAEFPPSQGCFLGAVFWVDWDAAAAGGWDDGFDVWGWFFWGGILLKKKLDRNWKKTLPYSFFWSYFHVQYLIRVCQYIPLPMMSRKKVPKVSRGGKEQHLQPTKNETQKSKGEATVREPPQKKNWHGNPKITLKTHNFCEISFGKKASFFVKAPKKIRRFGGLKISKNTCIHVFSWEGCSAHRFV